MNLSIFFNKKKQQQKHQLPYFLESNLENRTVLPSFYSKNGTKFTKIVFFSSKICIRQQVLVSKRVNQPNLKMFLRFVVVFSF